MEPRALRREPRRAVASPPARADAGQIIMGGTLQIQLSPWVRVAITRIFALGPSMIIATITIRNQRLFNDINQ